MAGTRAASCTSGSGENRTRSGSARSCSTPRTAPLAVPHQSMRFATFLASALGSPCASFLFNACGMKIVARLLRAYKIIVPSCHSCKDMVCAAADVPVASI
eukprot:scaffold1414_cov384-Prasinococcus_capsulatus_cf.AAC.18